MAINVKYISHPKMNVGIDILRHIFSFLIILQHMHSVSRYSFETNTQLTQFVNWIDGAVLGFFCISGYLYKQQLNLRQFAVAQIKKLIVPYFVFSIIYAVSFSLLGKYTISEVLLRIPTSQNIGIQLYFLPYLFFVTIKYWWLSHHLKFEANKYIEYIILVIFLLLSLFLHTNSSTGPDLKLLPLYFAAFLIGRIYKNLEISKTSNMFLICIGLFCALLGVLGVFDRRFFDIIGIIFLLSLVSMGGRYMHEKRIPGSGGVYLLHTPLVNFAISTFLSEIGIIQWPNIIFSALLTYGLCIVVTMMLVTKAPKYRWLLLE